jgi:hypothetical protein
VREQGLAHSVAHATYSINNRLTFEQIEKLLLLFDSFEAINGSRSRYANEVFQRALNSLTPERMENLKLKYGFEPFSDTPWRVELEKDLAMQRQLLDVVIIEQTAPDTAAMVDMVREVGYFLVSRCHHRA